MPVKGIYIGCPSFEPQQLEASYMGGGGLIVEHHAVRHGRLQGIPELNIGPCTWGNKQNIIMVKTDEWKNKAAEDLTHT